MELIKRSKNITVAMSELLHQSVGGTNVCKSFHGTNLDEKNSIFDISFLMFPNKRDIFKL